MRDIHLIEKTARYNRVAGTQDQWTTGTWKMAHDTAMSLIGGNVYLHTAQLAPCYLGGEILGCEEVGDGRYTIHFRFNEDLVNTTTQNCQNNWSVEMLLEPVVTA